MQTPWADFNRPCQSGFRVVVVIATQQWRTPYRTHHKGITMKKAIASGLIGLIALGGGAAIAAPSAFAQDAEDLTQEERTEQRQEARAERRAQKVETLTNLLGISEDELQTARQAGDSIADIAAAQGVDLQAVIDALVDNAQARIDAKVAAGDIDAERAAEKTESLEERITAKVNGEGRSRGAAATEAAPAA